MKDSGVEWLGAVPAHWEVVPPTALFTENKERARHGDQMLSATQKYGVIPLAEFEAMEQRQVTKAAANLEMRKHVEVGDFVISMRSMDGGLERARAVGSVRSSYSVLKAGPDVEGRFFGALMKSSLYIQTLRLTSSFIRDGQDLNFSHVRKVRLPKPGLAEQAAIADYLDCATTRIDALIARKTRFIELLREKRQALITHAVTKGLDAGVPMKDSGVQWLREVPAHWVVGRLRDFSQSISTGPFGTALGSGDYVEDGTPVINPSHISEEGCAPDNSVSVNNETAERLAIWRMSPGDIVTARRGELGRSSIITDQESGWICGTGSLRIRPNRSKATSEYIHTFLHSVSARSWLEFQSVGSTMPNLSEALIGNLPIAVPPRIEEQTELLSKLSTARLKVDLLIAKTERSIELLREHRTALITAAVTGKIDLREAA